MQILKELVDHHRECNCVKQDWCSIGPKEWMSLILRADDLQPDEIKHIYITFR